ncbi:proline-rich protein 36-like [Hypomesus transpacificus]|uniref:proline-rich protein 36-like n=1 Tax=Hypomesus transpacificus TaxID=137520 RepID=UPI001F085094|nr:proline-rich protein 36-like [Hypomesus transpacificus]
MKPSRRRFQEAWSIPIDGDGPNGPHVANVISHRSRKYNRKSPTMPSIVDQPFNRDNRGNQAVWARTNDQTSPEKRGLGLESPVVECGEDSMTLTVRGGRTSLKVERANTSGLPLSRLPPQCGYSVKTNSRDLSFDVPYNACHVQQEDGRHVLPLIWRGIPVEMSCPVSETQTQPRKRPSPTLAHVLQFLKSSVCCTSNGLTFILPEQGATAELQVKVRGEWRPLLPLAWQCGYSLNRQHGGEMLVSASYTACGVLTKDGQHTLALRIEEEVVTLVCPAGLSDEAPAIPVRQHPTMGSSSPSSETWVAKVQPFYTHTSSTPPWPRTSGSPPTSARFSVHFSAAIHPHPHPHIYHYHRQHQNPLSESYWAPYPTNDPLLHPRPTVGPAGSEPGLKPPTTSPPTPSGDSYTEAHTTQTSTSILHSFEPVHPRSAPLQTSDMELHPYYHFYHHPKIPVPFPEPDPNPAEEPRTGKQTVPSKRAVWVDPPAPISSPPTSRTRTISYPIVPWPRPKTGRFVPLPSPRLNYPPRADLHSLSRPPGKQIEESAPADAGYESHPRGRIRWLPWLLDPRAGPAPSFPPSSDPPQILNLNPKTGTPPLPSPSQPLVPLYHTPPPPNYLDSPLSKSASRNTPQQDTNPATPPPAPSPDPLPPPFIYIYHPYYYQDGNPYRTPLPDDILPPPSTTPGTTPSQSPVPTVTMAPRHHSVSARSHHKSKMASGESRIPPRVGPLPNKHLPMESPLVPDIPPDHPLYPYYYYYYHQYYQPSEPTPDQDRGSTPMPVLELSKPPLVLDQLVTPPSGPSLEGMLYSQPSPPMSQQQQDNLHPKFLGDEKVTEKTDFSSVSDTQTPCGLGSICSGPVGSYTVKGCTAGRHFVFVVPSTLVESTVSPPLSLKASNVSCTPQRLMRTDSTLSDVYTVPLHGCGVQKYEAGQTVVHLLEVRGFQAPPTEAGGTHQDAPIRLMVECMGSPGMPGKITIRRMSPSPSPPVQTPGRAASSSMAVQLRIATDEQYNHFLPEPHLPLALLLGRPLYLELVLLNPPEPGSVLLVHHCLAYTQSPHTGWMLVYDGCPRDGALPASPPSDTRRLTVTAFQALSTQRPLPLQTGSTTPHPENPEVHFLCSTEVCSPTDRDCSVGCITVRYVEHGFF